MKHCLRLFFALIMISNSDWARAGESYDFFENMKKIRINWHSGYVTGKGAAHPAAQHGANSELRSRMALAGAKDNAVKNLFKAIWNIRINSEIRVADVASKDIIILNKIIESIKALPIVGHRTLPDGSMEVMIRMNLRDNFFQLTLPQNIKKLESIKPVISNKKQANKTSPRTEETSSDVFTGLIVNARDIKARPAIAPRILDKDGNEIYGAAFASREFAALKGMSGYMTDIKAAQKSFRVGEKPLIVRGLKPIGPGRSDIVISNLDASKLRGSSEHLVFLKKCGVIIVID